MNCTRNIALMGCVVNSKYIQLQSWQPSRYLDVRHASVYNETGNF